MTISRYTILEQHIDDIDELKKNLALVRMNTHIDHDIHMMLLSIMNKELSTEMYDHIADIYESKADKIHAKIYAEYKQKGLVK